MHEFERLREIKLVVFDVDGIFTDGLTWQDARGQCRRCFSVRDGMGVRALLKAGFKVAVVSRADAPEIREHMALLGIESVHLGVTEPAVTMRSLLDRLQVAGASAAFVTMSDDDAHLLKSIGCGITVPNASPALKSAAHFVTGKCGGDGAVLEICNRILFGGAQPRVQPLRRAVG